MERKRCHQVAGGLLVLVVFSCFVGCGSVPEASLAGNFYTYDYELLLSFTESNYLYQQSAGMRMYQDYTKTVANVVVQMQDSGFVEPDYGYLLEISPSGRLPAAGGSRCLCCGSCFPCTLHCWWCCICI